MAQTQIALMLSRQEWEALLYSNRVSIMAPIIDKLQRRLINQDIEKYGISSTNHPG